MRYKYIIGLLIPLLFAACMQKRERLINFGKTENRQATEYYYAEECRKKGEFEQALVSYWISIDESTIHDSIPYWWKAKLGQGQVLLEQHKYTEAKKDFSDILIFAEKHHIDSALYYTHRNLYTIAVRSGKYQEALTHILQAKRAASAVGIQDDIAPQISLSQAAKALQEGTLPDTLLTELNQLRNSPNPEISLFALTLLIQYDNAPDSNNYLKDFLHAQSVYHEMETIKHTEQLEHEKGLIKNKLDTNTRNQQNILIIFCLILAFTLSCSIYIVINNKRKQEMNDIRLILEQKEEFIRVFEAEKNEQIALYQQEIEEKERLHEHLKQNYNSLDLKFKQAKEQQKQQEETFCMDRFFNTKIGGLTPAPGNPMPPKPEQFDKLLVKSINRKLFVSTYNICFNGFVQKLQILIPKLTEDDIMYYCLFKLNVRTRDIARMLCLERNTISTRKKRLMQKIEMNKEITSTDVIFTTICEQERHAK